MLLLLMFWFVIVDIANVGCVHLEHHGAHLAHPTLGRGLTHTISQVLAQNALFLLGPIISDSHLDGLRSIAEDEVQQTEDEAYDSHHIGGCSESMACRHERSIRR